MQFHEVISEAVSSIQSNEKRRVVLANSLDFLRSQDFSGIDSSDFPEAGFVFSCLPRISGEHVVGVDSGFCAKSLHSVDLVLVRAVGVCFSFEGGLLKSAEYEPGFYRFPKPFLFSDSIVDLFELEQSKSLIRLGEEITLARKLIEKHHPDFCLLDGSLIPQYADKPPKESGLTSAYHSVLAAFRSLYETATQNHCELVGCVEDSRGNRFRSILAENVLPFFRKESDALFSVSDSVLLNYVLRLHERTFAFPYTKKVSEHPILTDLDPWGNRVFACYLKPSAMDRPLRIEFLHDPSQGGPALRSHADRVGSVVMGLAGLHREYAYPSVLIEADLRSRLTPEEIDLVFNKIRDKLGHSVAMPLRRNSRPF